MMTKQSRTLLFLKSTGALIGEITADTAQEALDLTQFHVKTINIADDGSEFWQGDYYTGSVVSRNDRPIVAESVLKYNTNVKILTEYPVHTQVNIIIDMLKNSGLPKTAEFEELCSYLDTVRDEHRQKVAKYSSNPEAYVWYSYEQELADLKKKIIT